MKPSFEAVVMIHRLRTTTLGIKSYAQHPMGAFAPCRPESGASLHKQLHNAHIISTLGMGILMLQNQRLWLQGTAIQVQLNSFLCL